MPLLTRSKALCERFDLLFSVRGQGNLISQRSKLWSGTGKPTGQSMMHIQMLQRAHKQTSVEKILGQSFSHQGSMKWCLCLFQEPLNEGQSAPCRLFCFKNSGGNQRGGHLKRIVASCSCSENICVQLLISDCEPWLKVTSCMLILQEGRSWQQIVKWVNHHLDRDHVLKSVEVQLHQLLDLQRQSVVLCLAGTHLQAGKGLFLHRTKSSSVVRQPVIGLGSFAPKEDRLLGHTILKHHWCSQSC